MNTQIKLTDDELISDEQLALDWHVTQRSLARYEKQPDGLPFVLLGGRKYRPVKACRAWLERRIRKPNPRRAA